MYEDHHRDGNTHTTGKGWSSNVEVEALSAGHGNLRASADSTLDQG